MRLLLLACNLSISDPMFFSKNHMFLNVSHTLTVCMLRFQSTCINTPVFLQSWPKKTYSNSDIEKLSDSSISLVSAKSNFMSVVYLQISNQMQDQEYFSSPTSILIREFRNLPTPIPTLIPASKIWCWNPHSC